MATIDDLIALPRFSYTSLDFVTIIDDLKNIIQENPEYNQNWEDFLASNAGKMILELSAYVVDMLALRTDWVAGECYIGTATQKQSIINLLKLINYRLRLPSPSAVNVDVALSEWVPPFSLPTLMTLSAPDLNGDTTTFELIKIDTNNEYIYFGDDAVVILDTGTISAQKTVFVDDDALTYYQGVTQIQDDTMEGVDNETVLLDEFPVVEGSIQIWTLNSLSDEVEKLPLTASFVAEEAQQKSDGAPLTVPPYMIEVDNDNKVTINFGSSSLVNIFNTGDSIRIYYRKGGGIETNIVIGAINETRTYVVSGTPVIATLSNSNAAAGGTNSEDIEEAKREAPLYLTTAGKTVTPADYRRILRTHSSVFKVAAYGKVNEPAEIFDEYGFTIPTYETWIYIVPNLSNWSSLSVRDDYNAEMQITKPYEIKTDKITFPVGSLLAGTISFDKLAADPTEVIGNGTSFITDLEPDDVLVVPGTGTGSELFVGVVDYIETGSDTVLHFKEEPSFSAVDQNYGISSMKVQLPSAYTPIYRSYASINLSYGISTYIKGIDYEIDYDRGIITRYSLFGGYGVPDSQLITVTWWWHDQESNSISDVDTLELFLANKKMLCITNVYHDTLFTAFDIQGIVYVEKNYNQDLVKEQVDAVLFFNYSLLNRDFKQTLHLPEIISDIQAIPGIRYVDVQYFGKDYSVYKLDPESPPSIGRNYKLDEMECKYNEIVMVSHNEFEGIILLPEYQEHGVIFDYTEVPR